MRFHFVTTRRGSQFMTELLAAVADAVAAAGHVAEIAFDAFPPLAEDAVYVCIPHEFEAWGAREGWPDAAQRARTIAFCTENPGTPWFEATQRLLGEFALAVSINRSSAEELRRRGFRCDHLQLGYCPRWDRWKRAGDRERAIDVLYLGAADPRRDPLLGAIGGEMWHRRCQFLVPPLEPRTAPRPDFLLGTDKYDRLRSAKVLLNLHRESSSAFEWMRFLEAICNGCVVVSEESEDSEPLRAGEHFLTADPSTMATTVNALLDDPEELRRLRTHAYDYVRTQLPMEPAGIGLAQLAAELPLQPPGSPAPAEHAAGGSPAATTEVEHPARARPRDVPGRFATAAERAARAVRGPTRVLVESDSYQRTRPAVSVLAVLGDADSDRVAASLASAAASDLPDIELLALATVARSRTAKVARRLVSHAGFAAQLLVGDDSSLGVLLARARGEFVFVLDPAGRLFPTTLTRLHEALAGDPRAAFSYGIVACQDDQGRPIGLRGALPWEPERLVREIWIDPMALIRRSLLGDLAGLASDGELAGWGTAELWWRFAKLGMHGVQIPQVLAARELPTGTSPLLPVPESVATRLLERYP